MRGSFCDIGVLKPSEVVANPAADDRFSSISYGRFIANVKMLRNIGDLMPGTSAEAIEQQIFGTSASGLTSENSNRRLGAVAMKMPPQIIPAAEEAQRHARRVHLVVEGEDVARNAGRYRRRGRPASAEAQRALPPRLRPHCIATMLAQAMYEQVETLAEKAPGSTGWSTLITGYGDMEEAQVSRRPLGALPRAAGPWGFIPPATATTARTRARCRAAPGGKTRRRYTTLAGTYRTGWTIPRPPAKKDDSTSAAMRASRRRRELLAALPRPRRPRAHAPPAARWRATPHSPARGRQGLVPAGDRCRPSCGPQPRRRARRTTA